MHVRVRKLAEKKRKVQGESERGGQDHFHKGEAGDQLGMRIPEANSGLQHPGFTALMLCTLKAHLPWRCFRLGWRAAPGRVRGGLLASSWEDQAAGTQTFLT